MAKHIVKYKMHDNETPYFIQDGGHFPLNGEMIGVTKDSDSCFVPKRTSQGGDLVDMNPSELISYVVSMTRSRYGVNGMQVMDSAEKTSEAEAWLTARGFEF